MSDFIAAFVAPHLKSPVDLADAVRQQEFNLNVPIDLKRPLDQGLNHTHNFYLELESGLKIGVW